MAKKWLWLVAVGVSDVQLPINLQGTDRTHASTYRFLPSRANCKVRALHEVLLELLEQGRIAFPVGDLPPRCRESDGMTLEVQAIDPGEYWFHYASSLASQGVSNFGIGSSEDQPALDSGFLTKGQKLSLYCPKLAPILDHRSFPHRDSTQPTVIVLQTCRSSVLNPQEPIAAGPLVSRYLADRLRLAWKSPSDLTSGLTSLAGVATWIDLLRGDEITEDDATQSKIRQRLLSVLQTWEQIPNETRGVWVTSSGGLPELKSVIEYSAARAIGADRIQLMNISERASPKGQNGPEAFRARPVDRDVLRLNAVEALRRSDLSSALGLARREMQVFPQEPWPKVAVATLSMWLGWSDAGVRAEPPAISALLHHERLLLRAELALCRSDFPTALFSLHAWLENTSYWAMQSSPTMRRLAVHYDGEADAFLLPDRPSEEAISLLGHARDKAPGSRRLVTWSAISALSRCSDDPLFGCFEALHALIREYTKPDSSGLSLKSIRNQLAHEGTPRVQNSEISKRLALFCSVPGLKAQIGQNLLALNSVVYLERAIRGDSQFRLDTRFHSDLTQLITSGARDD